MKDKQGQATHALTQAKGWIKDNRLLPQGYRFDHPDAHYTQPVGVENDDNFNTLPCFLRLQYNKYKNVQITGFRPFYTLHSPRFLDTSV